MDQETFLTLADLPSVGQPLNGSTFVGIASVEDKPVAVVLLPDRATPGRHWRHAMAWAKELHAELPSPQIAAMLAHVNIPKPRLCWLSELVGSATARFIDYSTGAQHQAGIMSEHYAIAVRLVNLAGSTDREALERRIAALEARFAAQTLGDRVRSLEAHLATAT